ncbi:secondary thiamine-phosphate synthase enzyme YjbQ [Leptothoe sp. PORK10 BA2]|uniref:secondary thiamine-phosphate synthase enzyme YjbQ n=1 Tax=Leptothoe sp. PORK10 BA2 TaxID=3110254 RepID=UPI002B216357|nr:secondary thiamine-phosphate synthase enzyme YjbQ [Leptothoe sp. PORK10 BA2]MEA5466029.1 secondary thiamine-phosphate synthase enzyme YjbQ [Leptothoe sp. PORK10 BA2]
MPSTTSLTIHYQTILTLETRPKALQRFTMQVQDAVRESRVTMGLCCLFLRHTSASLVIQENADPTVLMDMETFLSKLVPEGADYRHNDEGPDDMPAHLRTALTHTSEQIPITNGRLALGTWQGIYLWEHRSRSHRRDVVVHITGI